MENITIGNSIQPPMICMDTTQDIYELMKSDEFEVETANSLLAALVVYFETHNIDFDDSTFPWAEEIGVTQ